MVQAVGNQLHAREGSGERGSQGRVAPSSAANVSRDVAQLLSLQALERKGVHEQGVWADTAVSLSCSKTMS